MTAANHVFLSVYTQSLLLLNTHTHTPNTHAYTLSTTHRLMCTPTHVIYPRIFYLMAGIQTLLPQQCHTRITHIRPYGGQRQ